MRRAFVVQIRDIRPGESFSGRAEHVRSGMAAHFGNIQEFVDFVGRMVTEEKVQEASLREEASPGDRQNE
ncbi:MAG: hypothetical protein JNL98_11100 [Bryobacterales bacterium]|nr:hypothetical protein [Bryobacterales bacterium]